MTLFAHIFAWRNPSSAGRTLAQHRVKNEREHVRAVGAQIRRELGLPPVEALR